MSLSFLLFLSTSAAHVNEAKLRISLGTALLAREQCVISIGYLYVYFQVTECADRIVYVLAMLLFGA